MRTISCKMCSKETEVSHHRAIYCSEQCGENYRKRARSSNVPLRLTELSVGARNRVKKKGIPHDIDGAYLLEVWNKQDGVCAITGQEFDLSYESKLQKGWSKHNAPSLDRIVPELGYTKGNVRIVAFQVNCAMGNYSDEEFYRMCQLALEYK